MPLVVGSAYLETIFMVMGVAEGDMTTALNVTASRRGGGTEKSSNREIE